MPRLALFFFLVLLFFLNFSAYAADAVRLNQANRLESEGKLEEAVREYRALLLEEPENPRWFTSIARLRENQGKYKFALRNYQQALRLDPLNSQALIGLAGNYEKLGQKDKAIASWRKLASSTSEPLLKQEYEARIRKLLGGESPQELQPPDHSVLPGTGGQPESPSSEINNSNGDSYNYDGPLFEQAMNLYQERNYPKSLEYWRKVLQAQPGNPGAYYWAGVCRYNLSDLPKARYNFKQSFAYPEKGFNAWFYLGRIAEKQGRLRDAVQNFKNYIARTESETGKKEARNRIASLQEKLKSSPEVSAEETTEKEPADPQGEKTQSKEDEPDYNAAGNAPQKSMVLSGTDVAVLIHDTLGRGSKEMIEGFRLAERKLMNQAMDNYKKVRLQYPASPNANAAAVNLIRLYLFLGLADHASNLAGIALRERMPENYANLIRFLAARSKLEEGRVKDADRQLQSVEASESKLGPSKKEILALRGEVAAALGEGEKKSLSGLEKTIEATSDPEKKSELLLTLARQQQENKKTTEAARTLQKLFDVCQTKLPELCREGYFQMADMQFRNKSINEARKFYEKVIQDYPDSVDTPWGVYQLGNIAAQKKDFRSAVQWYDKLLEEYPNSYWAEQAKWKKEDAIWMEEYQNVLR
jgi:tetratricopeptide (TPR) repeat protein